MSLSAESCVFQFPQSPPPHHTQPTLDDSPSPSGDRQAMHQHHLVHGLKRWCWTHESPGRELSLSPLHVFTYMHTHTLQPDPLVIFLAQDVSTLGTGELLQVGFSLHKCLPSLGLLICCPSFGTFWHHQHSGLILCFPCPGLKLTTSPRTPGFFY